jgi:hypothetical protein
MFDDRNHLAIGEVSNSNRVLVQGQAGRGGGSQRNPPSRGCLDPFFILRQ